MKQCNVYKIKITTTLLPLTTRVPAADMSAVAVSIRTAVGAAEAGGAVAVRSQFTGTGRSVVAVTTGTAAGAAGTAAGAGEGAVAAVSTGTAQGEGEEKGAAVSTGTVAGQGEGAGAAVSTGTAGANSCFLGKGNVYKIGREWVQ